MCGVQHKLVLAIGVLVDRHHLRYRAAVRRREGRLPAGPVDGVPNLKLVLVAHRQHLVVVAFATKRVPNATSRPCLLFDDRVGRHDLETSELRALHAVLNKPAVLAHREESQLLGLGAREAKAHNRPPVLLVLRGVHPLLRVIPVVISVPVPVQAHALVCMRECQERTVVTKGCVRDVLSQVTEGHDLRQVRCLEELEMPVHEPDAKQFSIRREPKDVRHEFFEDLHEMERPRVVIPKVQEAGVATDRHEGQGGVAT
mmetsp:Transcript_58889/g.164507  ORF Transcript_58889/g.164507 Transcript_58889/m.164507 type:complete len:257 (+) Transcript_58889:924-1694(+)